MGSGKEKNTMKKIIIITALFLMMFSVTAMGKYTRPYQPPARKKCSVSGCDRNRTSDSIYCDNHKCAQRGCSRKRQSGGIYCATQQSQYNKNVRAKYGSGRSSSSRSSFDPDDHDIEAYYDDYRDEYDDYDDAYDGFLDDEDAWDDY